jgi:D-sedoheptulose 7-phosphate isomerase
MNSLLISAVKAAKRVYIIGNGGSYANAMHICNDLLACGIPAFTLDPATMAASANDYGWDTVFERWIRTVGHRGDLLIALSGSGKSPNILKAVAAARELGMSVHCIFGNERSEDMQQAEEAQIRIGHELMRALKCQT